MLQDAWCMLYLIRSASEITRCGGLFSTVFVSDEPEQIQALDRTAAG